MKTKLNLAIYLIMVIILLIQTDSGCAASGNGNGNGHCKELNQVNCYAGSNEGNFCSSKTPTQGVVRWFFDKGVCRKFNYKGCNGNRNRFCTKESCENRCSGE